MKVLVRGSVLLLGICLRKGTPLAAIGSVDYDRAAKGLDANLKEVLKNALPDPHWWPGRKQFWYRRGRADDRPVALS